MRQHALFTIHTCGGEDVAVELHIRISRAALYGIKFVLCRDSYLQSFEISRSVTVCSQLTEVATIFNAVLEFKPPFPGTGNPTIRIRGESEVRLHMTWTCVFLSSRLLKNSFFYLQSEPISV